MAATSPTSEAEGGSRRGADALRAESLTTGVAVLVGMTLVQRLVGLLRNVLFCSLLADDQLGRWSLAFVFLMLAPPLAVLGLPGSFGRYVEHYRQRGQLRPFLRRTSAATAMLGLVAVLLMLLAPRWFALLLFGDSRASSLATSLGAALGTVIAFNFLVELFTALRQIRVASLMQLANNVVFTVLSVGLLCFTGLGEQAVILAFGAGALAAIVGGGLRLRSAWRSLPPAARPLPCQELATKLLPFAAWVWLTNLLANLFVSADQYMIKHFSGLDAAAADSVVGQYYSSRIVPVLLIGAAGTLSSIILPHLSFDWEAGRRRAVSQRLNLALKLIGLAFTCGAALVMLGAPWLFGWVLHGKYSDGLAVLPWTLIYSAWFSLAVVAQNYLWCAEKAGLSSLALALGLAVDVALNLVLLPRFGLAGAVLAAAAANAAALAITYELSRRLGLERDRGVWVVSALPLAIAGGAGPAAAIVVLTGWFAARSSWLFNSREKQELAEAARSCLGRLQRLVGSREPASA